MFVMLYIFFQIVGESFPISSSGHLIFLQKVYFFFFPASAELIIPSSFDYILHIPTVIIVCIYFFRRLYYYFYMLVTRHTELYPIIRTLCIVDGITACCYLGKTYGEEIFPLWLGFLITGCSLFSLSYLSSQRSCKAIEDLSFKNALLIGCAQVLSLLPGVSRFGLTYTVARFQGLSSNDSFFYSFLIALPLFGAAGLKGVVTMLTSSNTLALFDSSYIIIGSIVLATIISYYSFVVVGSFIRTNKLWYISYYMFLISLLAGVYSLLI